MDTYIVIIKIINTTIVYLIILMIVCKVSKNVSALVNNIIKRIIHIVNYGIYIIVSIAF
jgi:hypothetical protein